MPNNPFEILNRPNMPTSFKTLEDLKAWNEYALSTQTKPIPSTEPLEKSYPRKLPYNNTLSKLYPKYKLQPISNGYKLEDIISNIKARQEFEFFGFKYLADTSVENRINNKTVIGYVNERYGFVNPTPSYVEFKVVLDPKAKKIEYYRCINFDSNLGNTIDYKYALTIGSTNFQDFLDIADFLGYSIAADLAKKDNEHFQYLLWCFNDAFKDRTLDNLNFLYAQAPPVVLKERSDELLWFDFVLLGRYGWGTFSPNTTSALLNLLWGFSSPLVLYTKFLQNQDTLMSIYEGIDTFEHKHVFCSFLIALTQALQAEDLATQNQAEYSVVKFDGANNFSLDASYENGYIRIKNEKINYETKHAGKAGSVTQEKDRTALLQKSYAPMALLYYEYTNAEGNTKKIKVPALYILYMVQHRSYEKTWTNIRLGFDVLVLLASLHPLAGGVARGARAGLLLDATLAATDIVVLSQKDTDYLMQIEGECPEAGWFVENWDTIYLLLGMGSLSVQLVEAVATKGPVLMRFLRIKGDNLSLVDKVAALLKTISPITPVRKLNEVPIVASKTKTLFEKIGFGYYLKTFFTEELQLRLIKSHTSDAIEVMYKEAKVYEGEEKEVKKWLDELYMKDTKKTQKWLEGMYAKRELIKKLELVFEKWKGKFEGSFKNHLEGEAGLESIKLKSGLQTDEFVTIGQGGHQWTEKIRLKEGKLKIPNPPIINEPYLAEIDVAYRGEWLPKKQISSIFPENWTLERIQQEVAWVYENTVAKGSGKLPRLPQHKFNHFQAECTLGFDILIEVDDAGNIMNAYPKILN